MSHRVVHIACHAPGAQAPVMSLRRARGAGAVHNTDLDIDGVTTTTRQREETES